MIMNYFKKYSTVFLFSIILSAFIYFSNDCMHTMKDIFNKTTSISLYFTGVVLQLPIVNGDNYNYDAQTACCMSCLKTCQYACDTLFDHPISFGVVGSTVFILSMGTGYLVYTKCHKEKSANHLTE